MEMVCTFILSHIHDGFDIYIDIDIYIYKYDGHFISFSSTLIFMILIYTFGFCLFVIYTMLFKLDVLFGFVFHLLVLLIKFCMIWIFFCLVR